MPKLRFAIVLPLAMLCIGFMAMRWENHVQSHLPPKRDFPFVSTATFVFDGLNAPAVLIEGICVELFPVYRVDQPPPTLFGIGIGRAIFWPLVALLWCGVGFLVDCRRARVPLPGRQKGIGTLVNLLLVCLALVLCYMGIRVVVGTHSPMNPLGSVLEGILFVGWSVILVMPTAMWLLGVIGGSHLASGQE